MCHSRPREEPGHGHCNAINPKRAQRTAHLKYSCSLLSYKVNIQQTELGEHRFHLNSGMLGEAQRDSHPRKGRNEDAVWDLLFVFQEEILQGEPARRECLSYTITALILYINR